MGKKFEKCLLKEIIYKNSELKEFKSSEFKLTCTKISW